MVVNGNGDVINSRRSDHDHHREDLAILRLDPHTGRRLVDGTALDRPLAAAAIIAVNASVSGS
jgi:hypothetical protein